MSRAQRAAKNRRIKRERAELRAKRLKLRAKRITTAPVDLELDDFELEVMAPRNTPAPVVRGPQLEIAAAAPSSPAREPWDTPDHRRQRTIDQRAGATSANRQARERKYVKSVVSLRLSASLLDDIDEFVRDAIGAVPPLTRTSIIEDAVTQYLAEIHSQRRRAS